MIQLATDPNASRSNWRPATAEAREASPATPVRGAWPFISRYGERAPTPQATQRPTRAGAAAEAARTESSMYKEPKSSDRFNDTPRDKPRADRVEHANLERPGAQAHPRRLPAGTASTRLRSGAFVEHAR